jgi:hypothetical protein
MIHQNIPQPIPFYNASGHRTTARENCRGQIIDGAFYPNTHVPAFVIERDPSGSEDVEVRVVRRDDMFSANQGPGSMEIVNTGGKDYIFSPSFAMVTPVPPGEYYLRVDDGGTLYYSEIFRMSDCTPGMASFEWSDTCKRTGIPWQLAPDGFVLKFWMDTHTGPSLVLTDEEVEDDGEVETVTSTRTVIQTSIADVFPDHVLQCFHAMKHHTNVILTDGRVYNSVRIGQIAATPVADGCKQFVTVPMILQDLRKGCCDGSGEDTECVTVDAEEVLFALTYQDETWFDANSSATDKGLQLIDDDGWARVHVNGSFPYYAEVGKYYMADQLDDLLSTDVLYFITGTLTEPIANLINPEIIVNMETGAAVIGAQSFITGRFAQIQYSTDGGSTWLNDSTVSEAELQEGVTGVEIRLPEGHSMMYRVRYYTIGCEFGYSPVFVGAIWVESGSFTGHLPFFDVVDGRPIYYLTGTPEWAISYSGGTWQLSNNVDATYEVVDDARHPFMITGTWTTSGVATTPLPTIIP